MLSLNNSHSVCCSCTRLYNDAPIVEDPELNFRRPLSTMLRGCKPILNYMLTSDSLDFNKLSCYLIDLFVLKFKIYSVSGTEINWLTRSHWLCVCMGFCVLQQCFFYDLTNCMLHCCLLKSDQKQLVSVMHPLN